MQTNVQRMINMVMPVSTHRWVAVPVLVLVVLKMYLVMSLAISLAAAVVVAVNAHNAVLAAAPSYAPGDMNCDGEVDFGDINPFVQALSDPAGYDAAYPDCDIMNADINDDGEVDFGDINPFVALLTG